MVQIRFARAGKPLRATPCAADGVGTRLLFYYTFAFFVQQLSTTTQKSISFMRITLRSCCSLVLISIVVVAVVKMLNHRQTHC